MTPQQVCAAAADLIRQREGKLPQMDSSMVSFYLEWVSRGSRVAGSRDAVRLDVLDRLHLSSSTLKVCSVDEVLAVLDEVARS